MSEGCSEGPFVPNTVRSFASTKAVDLPLDYGVVTLWEEVCRSGCEKGSDTGSLVQGPRPPEGQETEEYFVSKSRALRVL